MKYLRSIFVFWAVLGVLSACQSSKNTKFQDSGFHITSVEVTLPAQHATHKSLQYSEDFKPMLDNVLSRYATEYNATRPAANKAYTLLVDVEKVHFKNPLQSLLIGDGNYVSGTAKLIDPSTGQGAHGQTFKYLDAASVAVNGISGAVLSVVVKKQAAEATLSKGVAKAVMKNIYPEIKLPSSAKSRLKGKAVLQPPTTALSPLSASPVAVPETEDAGPVLAGS